MPRLLRSSVHVSSDRPRRSRGAGMLVAVTSSLYDSVPSKTGQDQGISSMIDTCILDKMDCSLMQR